MKKKICLYFLGFFIVLLLCGCSRYSRIDDHIMHSDPLETIEEDKKEGKMTSEDSVAELMSGMSIREKVGQLFFVRPDAIDINYTLEEIQDSNAEGSLLVSGEMEDFYRDYPAGGFVIFGKNIDNPEQLSSFVSQLHGLNEIQPMICIDEEGGMVSRIANSESFDVEKFPNMQTIAESGDAGKAYYLGSTIGDYLNRFGFDVDFAPVADVNTNPDNPVIGVRAFGNNPELAGEMVASVLNGLHDSGIMGCIKHFPGHGDTKTDTHSGYAETSKSWEEIKSCEILPFLAGIDAGTDMVMAAHIAAPDVTGTDEPCSLSYTMLTEKLRNEIGYDGIIITDALAMDAIKDKYSSSEASVLAFSAGADILLMPYDYAEAFEGMVKAVEEGKISISRLDESVYRILTAKYNCN